MANIAKKREKLTSRIKEIEDELALSLQKKSSSQAEINLPGKMKQIQDLKRQLATMV